MVAHSRGHAALPAVHELCRGAPRPSASPSQLLARPVGLRHVSRAALPALCHSSHLLTERCGVSWQMPQWVQEPLKKVCGRESGREGARGSVLAGTSPQAISPPHRHRSF